MEGIWTGGLLSMIAGMDLTSGTLDQLGVVFAARNKAAQIATAMKLRGFPKRPSDARI
jgi:hypothetical protein